MAATHSIDLSGVRVCPDLWPLPASAPPSMGGISPLSSGPPPARIGPELALPEKSLWTSGDTIRVTFLDGQQQLQDRVTEAAQEWTQYASLRLHFVTGEQADIRISFKQRDSWSKIGTDCRLVSPGEPTMNYGWLTPESTDEEVSQVVLHEFGHALGCGHEHQHPSGGINWNRPAVYAYYAGRPYFWNRDKVDRNIFDTYDRDTTIHSRLDPSSIMMYPIDRRLTTDGFEVALNKVLSDTDKEFITTLYP